MIRFNIPGFYDSDFESANDKRNGDCSIIYSISEDNEINDVLIIDGYCGKPALRMISRLKEQNIKSPYLLLSHPHYDHYYALRKIINDKWFTPKALYCHKTDFYVAYNSDIKTNINVLKSIINEAKARKIPVIYVEDCKDYSIGDIEFTTYINKPSYGRNSDAYINDGSICCWFSKLSYLTTGDAGLEVAKQHNLHPLFIKGGHHGNHCVRVMAIWLYARGCRFYWDNDYSEKLYDFLMTGREDALAVGMKFFNIHGDINFVFYGGKCVIYKDGKHYEYECAYNGKSALKLATLQVVYDTCSGKYENSDERVTNLIDAGYYPSNTQTWVNRFAKLFKG